MVSRRRCVTDSSIWIDLHAAELTTHAFCLPLKLSAPDLVIGELRSPDGRELIAKGLHVEELSGELLEQVVELAAGFGRVSRTDLSALVVALDQQAILLTGDKALRSAAEARGVEVHGTLWVLDSMVERGIIDGRQAVRAGQQMVRTGSRFPEDELRRRVRRWRGSG